MQFDLPQVDTRTLSESGVDMPVKSLQGEPLLARNGKPIAIRLLGPDSGKYRALTRAQVRKRMAQMSDGKVSLTEEQFEEADRDIMDILAACTVGWSNVLDTDGTEIAFSEENVRKLYANYPVVREQVDTFLANRANFLPASSTN